MDEGKTLRKVRLDAGLTQRQLAKLSGISQPRIAAFETGKVVPRAESVQALLKACRIRPSIMLNRHKDAVCKVAERQGVRNLRVFGSVARGEDDLDSDIDLIADFPKDFTYVQLCRLATELEEILGVPVDLIGDRGRSDTIQNARKEAVAL